VGYDVSFHPVDVAFIHERVFPYIRGERSIDDLVAQAVRIARVRFRANAWGLGVLACEQAQRASSRSRKGQEKPPALAVKVPKTFKSHLHVWGRPFFITQDRPADISAAIDQYLAAAPEQVDELARRMLRHLDPDLVEAVIPDEGGVLPEEERLAEGIQQEIALFRECYQARKTHQQVTIPSGETASPRELFAYNFPLAVLDFAAHFRPGWMARGRVWPSYLLSEANLYVEGIFETPAALFRPILEEIPEIADHLEPTITQNYMIGGYVPADKVPALRRLFEENQDHFPDECRLDVQKILEAVRDAELRRLAFAEATEIYSGIEGIMN
jgi:hypothetical protein